MADYACFRLKRIRKDYVFNPYRWRESVEWDCPVYGIEISVDDWLSTRYLQSITEKNFYQ